MKAIVYEEYGSYDVLKLKEVDEPTLTDNSVMVRIHAASVNGADLDLLKGKPFLVRLMYKGLLKPRYKILGADIAGKVEEVGAKVLKFRPGDEVFADLSEYGFGAFANYVCVPENALKLKPSSLTFKEAAATPQAAVIALQSLCGKRKINPGQKILIIGAGGGVGTFAVQIAKSFGAEVTGVDSKDKLEMLLKIGADLVIDYTQEDFIKNDKHYDIILAIAGYHSILEYKRALNPKGSYVFVGGPVISAFQAMIIGSWISIKGNKKMGIMNWKPNKKEDLDFIIDLIEDRKVIPIIDKCYPLSEVAEAVHYLEEGRAKGKVIITMENKN